MPKCFPVSHNQGQSLNHLTCPSVAASSPFIANQLRSFGCPSSKVRLSDTMASASGALKDTEFRFQFPGRDRRVEECQHVPVCMGIPQRCAPHRRHSGEAYATRRYESQTVFQMTCGIVLGAVVNHNDLDASRLLTQGAFDRVANKLRPIPGRDHYRQRWPFLAHFLHIHQSRPIKDGSVLSPDKAAIMHFAVNQSWR